MFKVALGAAWPMCSLTPNSRTRRRQTFVPYDRPDVVVEAIQELVSRTVR